MRNKIINWSAANPKTRLHCFYDKPGAPAEFSTFAIAHISPARWREISADDGGMPQRRLHRGVRIRERGGVAGQPLFLVPVENHVEQQVNAIDAQQFGLGVAEKSFHLGPPR